MGISFVKTCAVCEKEFASSRRKYCSEDCRLESKRITARKWNRENKEKHAKHQRDHKERDPVAFRVKEKAYYNNKNLVDPGYYRQKTASYEAAKLNATPKWLTDEHKVDIAKMYAHADRLSAMTGIPHHVDHIHPLRGKLSKGLHVPWNLQVLTDSENCSKTNNAPTKRIVYMLCGQSGVGKTTLANEFKDKFEVVSYDSIGDNELLERVKAVSDKPLLLDIGIKISTQVKRCADVCHLRLVFMIESPEEVENRIISRGGKTSNILKRYNRIVKLSEKAYYSGNTEDVRCFLSEI
jgi:hypothetical protein